ncbi:helix-turn-helix domain-containing protein [Streptomyces wuyuanensis]|uniref:Helix-turn-helix domain-containing protein n=1 Tax=Streptomyces wuyuanensis TaxID=1196353 RepID=A0A1H0DXE5_9ACTN|nr:helix-turn-helix domain-containing protein [Streptomyces wuyuanensis]SDN74769.1 Helix-turn-helix domain-containing protein [Streptomyces wuyuanensis]
MAKAAGGGASPKEAAKQELGATLRSAMTERGWRQADLSRKSGVGETTISSILNGVSAGSSVNFNAILDSLYPLAMAQAPGRHLRQEEGEQRELRRKIQGVWEAASRREPRSRRQMERSDLSLDASGTAGRPAVRAGVSAAEAAERAAVAAERFQAQREVVDVFDRAVTGVLSDAREAYEARVGLPESWPDVEDALNALCRTGPQDVMADVLKAAREVRLLLILLPQSAACCAAIHMLDAEDRAALDQVALAVRWADGAINAHVHAAEERAREAMTKVDRMGGRLLLGAFARGGAP